MKINETVINFVVWHGLPSLQYPKDMVGKKLNQPLVRGFADDDDSVPEASHLKCVQEINMLELMQGQIANNYLIISSNSSKYSRNRIVKN